MKEQSAQGNASPTCLLVIGAGNRGQVYSQYALDFPDEARIVGIVDPHPYRRQHLGQAHSVDPGSIFASIPPKTHDIWTRVNGAIVAVPDSLHADIVLGVLERGIKYILLEKPMGTSREECRRIEKATREAGACVAVCHVLRYTPMNREIKSLIDSGEIGTVLNIQHTEPVGYYHFAHSYVRGNWRRTDESACSLLTKSCHDVDLIAFWMSNVPGGKVRSVSSFGSLRYFRRESKPAEAGNCHRCLDCPYEAQCPYSAKKVYLDALQKRGVRGWPVSVLVEDEVTEEAVLKALQEGPYGLCVYECDNDVCDNQVVNFQFDNGSTASFTMIATTEQVCTRQTKIYGSRAEVTANAHTNEIRVFNFLSRSSRTICPTSKVEGSSMGGHGYADYHLMHAFVRASANDDPTQITATANESLKSHSLVFDAEESRLSNIPVTLSW